MTTKEEQMFNKWQVHFYGGINNSFTEEFDDMFKMLLAIKNAKDLGYTVTIKDLKKIK